MEERALSALVALMSRGYYLQISHAAARVMCGCALLEVVLGFSSFKGAS
jgi:hypothetical protein